MIPFLSDEWCDLWVATAAGLDANGATGTYEVRLRDEDGQLEVFTLSFEDGVLTRVVGGEEAGRAADVHFETPRDVYLRYISGERGVMQRSILSGATRLTGDPDIADTLMRAFRTDAYRAMQRQVYEQTKF